MEKIKVRLFLPENDSYNEVWSEVGGKRYFARHTYCGSVWYYVCDPLGYCELDHACGDDLTFVVCDQQGNPLFESSNAWGASFPTLEGAAKIEWQKICNRYPTRKGLNDWLLSYMTPANLAKDPGRTQFCPLDNWTAFWFDYVEHKAIHEYEYLGEKYCIWALTYQHLFCECRWVTYYAGVKDMDWDYPSFIRWFGDWFEPVYGPMYSKSEAIKLLAQKVQDVYGRSHVSEIYIGYGDQAFERKLGCRDTAERLINGDLTRVHIDDMLEHGWDVHFYTSAAEMERDYPGYVPDYGRVWF